MKNKIITSIIALSFLTTPILSSAQTGVTTNFGGRIVMTNECLCSGGWMFWVLDIQTNMVSGLLLQFGISRLNANYNIFTPGVQTLGSYISSGTCLMLSTECGDGPTPDGTITSTPMPGVGTSLIPG